MIRKLALTFLACLPPSLFAAVGPSGPPGIIRQYPAQGAAASGPIPQFVQADIAQAGSADGVNVPFGSNTTAGNAIVACQSSYVSGGTTHNAPTDTGTNTYSLALSSALGDTQARISCWVALNISGGANTVAFTTNGTGDNTGIVAEYSNVATANAVDQIAGNVATAANPDSGPRTVTTATQLIVGAMAHNGGNFVVTAGTDFTIRESFNDATSGMPLTLEDKSITGGGSQSATFTQNSADYGALMLTLKAAP